MNEFCGRCYRSSIGSSCTCEYLLSWKEFVKRRFIMRIAISNRCNVIVAGLHPRTAKKYIKSLILLPETNIYASETH
jgi:hypothetical protein